jgi:hypothetical protein
MLINDDLPTFERPMKANSGRSAGGQDVRFGALACKVALWMIMALLMSRAAHSARESVPRRHEKEWDGRKEPTADDADSADRGELEQKVTKKTKRSQENSGVREMRFLLDGMKSSRCGFQTESELRGSSSPVSDSPHGACSNTTQPMVEIGAVIVLIALTVLVHGFGTFALVAWLLRNWRTRWQHASMIHLQLVLAQVVLLLFLLHVLEAAIWAGFYVWSGAMPGFHTALYFSLTSYTTVGYGDVLLDDQWRLLGVCEACIGVLMLGWSTGILFAIVARQFEALLHGKDPTGAHKK